MRTIIATIFSLLFAIFLLYLWTPDINFQSWGLWWTIFVGTVIIAVWGFIAESLSAKIPAVLVLLIMIFLALGSWSLFRADSYQELLGEPEVSDFTKDVSPISLMEMRIIDKDIAHKLGDKTLGEDPALGSVAEVNDFTLQSVGGKLYFVAPLEHSGFFRWLNNDYTTGYIKVSATNTNDISLVQSLNDKPIKIVYQPGGYFNQDLSRHIWLNGYMTTLTTNTEFEIDDEGNPWWIVTKYEKEVLKNGGFISDFWSDKTFDRKNFLKRNRIIAGLSEATIVIESAEKGGSLVTADIANSYNREVFALPGRPTDILSKGCNELIKHQKAQMITSATDLIFYLGWELEPQQPKQTQLFVELSPEEEKVLSQLKDLGKTELDVLALACQMPTFEITTYLLNLELNGLVRPLPGKMFEAI